MLDLTWWALLNIGGITGILILMAMSSPQRRFLVFVGCPVYISSISLLLLAAGLRTTHGIVLVFDFDSAALWVIALIMIMYEYRAREDHDDG